MSVKISATIITFNEEKNIERCLNSLKNVTDEIVVLDSLSTDRTKEICLQFGATFYEQPFLGYVEQKNKALELATYPYVLSLDADEALSDELKTSILAVKANWQHDAYSFNRLTNYCGKWVHHSGWYPDRKVRLFNKNTGRWTGDRIHESFLSDGKSTPRHISGDLLHYSYYSIDQHLDQIKIFTTIMAEVQHRRGINPSPFKLVFNPVWCFIRQFFLRLGFLDGYYGFVICCLSACANLIKYAKTRQLFQNRNML